jgi:cytochrome c oxidase subunit 2
MGSFPLFAASGQTSQGLSIFDPASPPAESIVEVSILVLAISAFIFLVVEGVLLYSVLRFRRRGPLPAPSPSEGPEGAGRAADATEPAQVYGSKPIEIAWTAAPAMIVFVLVLVTARTLLQVKIPPPEPKEGDKTLFVTVIGRQWWWEYRYDHYDGKPLGFITANELHVPAAPGKEPDEKKYRVFLTLESADVCHSFWVPRLAGKTDLIPGRTNHLWFRTAGPGLYLGQCAEYCGAQHANMLLRVSVDPADEFMHWLGHESKSASPDDPANEPQRAFQRQSCVNCHAVRGTRARGTYAPDLTHLMSRQTLASGMIPNTPDNLRLWVDDPQNIKKGCLMPAFGLGKRDRDLVLRYLLTLR